MPIKQLNIQKLYQVKHMVMECPHLECSRGIIETLNSVLWDENGPRAALYPYNNQEETILELWRENMAPENIALKLGIDKEIVQIVVEAPGNDVSEKELLKSH